MFARWLPYVLFDCLILVDRLALIVATIRHNSVTLSGAAAPFISVFGTP
jgi:hypothetical protein